MRSTDGRIDVARIAARDLGPRLAGVRVLRLEPGRAGRIDRLARDAESVALHPMPHSNQAQNGWKPSTPRKRFLTRPMGPCQGLKSAYSPRIVTSVKNGKLALVSSENMLR